MENKKDLGYYLEEISVLEPGMWDNLFVDENDGGRQLKDWYAVCNTKGIIAYFGNGTDAFRFRLDYINRKLNP